MSPTFDAGAEYAAHRPNYPDELPELLAGLPRHTRLAVDVGCGTGQLSAPLAAHFEQVIGVDVSASQIDAATAHPRVSYQVGSAEGLNAETLKTEPLKTETPVDLFTVAQAAHWIDDLDAFYERVRALAAPEAAIALISYGICRLEGLNEVYQEFYHGPFHRFWDPRRRHVEDGLSSLPFPFEPLAIDCPPIVRQHTFDQFIAYLGTWSATKAAREAGSTEFEGFTTQLGRAWGDPAQTRTVTWPVTVRAGRIHV